DYPSAVDCLSATQSFCGWAHYKKKGKEGAMGEFVTILLVILIFAIICSLYEYVYRTAVVFLLTVIALGVGAAGLGSIMALVGR
ncbi:MAG: hypothetical protein P8124_12190, partial [Gammaproteobacteria bacterium]